jgi:hypothetical protein
MLNRERIENRVLKERRVALLPVSSDIAAQANVGVQGKSGSRYRMRQTTLVTYHGQ